MNMLVREFLQSARVGVADEISRIDEAYETRGLYHSEPRLRAIQRAIEGNFTRCVEIIEQRFPENAGTAETEDVVSELRDYLDQLTTTVVTKARDAGFDDAGRASLVEEMRRVGDRLIAGFRGRGREESSSESLTEGSFGSGGFGGGNDEPAGYLRSSPLSRASPPADASEDGILTVDGEVVTVDGETIDFGTPVAEAPYQDPAAAGPGPGLPTGRGINGGNEEVSPGLIYPADGNPGSILEPTSLEATAELRPLPAAVRGAGAIASSGWTGKRTRKEQARIVLALAPTALEGVRALLADEEVRLHNRPPEAIGADHLKELRALHDALGHLIELAENGRATEDQLRSIEALSGTVMQWGSERVQHAISGLNPLISSAPAAFGTWWLLQLISSPQTLVTLGPAAVAAVIGTYLVGEKAPNGTSAKARPVKLRTSAPRKA